MPNETLTRAAPAAVTSWNADDWTFDVILSTGAGVERQDARGTFIEVLEVSGAAFPASIPLLDSHQRDSIDRRLGEVSGIRVAAGQLVGTARLSRHNPAAQRLAAEIGDGARFGISIGYRVDRWAERTNPATKRREKAATAFSLLEASLVAVPADPAATIRSENMPANTPASQTRAEINAEIRSIAASTGLDQSWIDGHLDAETADIDNVRADALARLAQRSQAAGAIRSTITVQRDHNDPLEVRAAMADALAHRLAPGSVKLEGRAVDYRAHSILDLVGDLAVARGERINLRDRDGLLERAVGAHSTSDFPLLLADAANKSLLANYTAAAPTYRQWAARRQFRDFREHSFLRIGDFPEFKEINEHGSTQYGTISENAEKVRAKEFGTGIAIGRRALINDDLSALSDFSSLIALRAASDENRKVYALLATNGQLSDGKALFHADHGNLRTPAAISVESIGLAVAALRKQTGLDGIVLNLAPRFLIVGADKELEARKIIAAITATKAADVNPWAGSLELIVDGEIAGNTWYVAVAPEAAPSIVYGYVAGSEGPQIRTEIDFDTRAVKVAAGLDFAAGTIDFRGLQKNAGA